jgi:hypothetical protein
MVTAAGLFGWRMYDIAVDRYPGAAQRQLHLHQHRGRWQET